MKMNKWILGMVLFVAMMPTGCEKASGPDLGGEITLSSQLHGTESYYLYGYTYESGEKNRYPSQEDAIPDIINEGYPVIDGSEQISLPGFNTPSRVNGFAMVGEFSTLEDADVFFRDYEVVEEGLQFEIVSDTVELYQVWVQQTSAGNFVKILIKEIRNDETETGSPYSEVTLEYVYSPGGSEEFSCGCD